MAKGAEPVTSRRLLSVTAITQSTSWKVARSSMPTPWLGVTPLSCIERIQNNNSLLVWDNFNTPPPHPILACFDSELPHFLIALLEFICGTQCLRRSIRYCVSRTADLVHCLWEGRKSQNPLFSNSSWDTFANVNCWHRGRWHAFTTVSSLQQARTGCPKTYTTSTSIFIKVNFQL